MVWSEHKKSHRMTRMSRDSMPQDKRLMSETELRICAQLAVRGHIMEYVFRIQAMTSDQDNGYEGASRRMIRVTKKVLL